MWWKWLQTHHKHVGGWKRDRLIRYMLYSQYPVRVFTPNTINNEIHTYADVPAPTASLPVAPMRPGHPQRGRGARSGQRLPGTSRHWSARCSPRGRSHGAPGTARGQRNRGECAVALCHVGGGWRFLRTPRDLAEAPVPPAAAGTRAQRPETTATALPAATMAAAAALGGGGAAAFRRPERLRRAVSGAV